MKKIAIFSTSRSEFGILKPLIINLKKNRNFKTFLFLGGTHLNKKYGLTIKEIRKDISKIDGYFNYLKGNESREGVVNSISLATKKLSLLFENNNFHYVCILGDRLELLSIVINCIVYNKKIIHIGGGDTTIGSSDNLVRDLLSRSSFLHMVLIKQHKEK